MRFYYFALAVLLINAVTAQSNPPPRPATLPPPKNLSVLDIESGSIIALRTAYVPAIDKGQGYLTLCNGCYPGVDKLAAHHGTTKDAKWSQFRIKIYNNNTWGYPVITLQNMYSREYLSATSSSVGNYASFHKNNKLFLSRWAALVVLIDGQHYLALMDSIPGLFEDPTPQIATLCNGCFINGGYELMVNPDNLANLYSYHLYTVEKIK